MKQRVIYDTCAIAAAMRIFSERDFEIGVCLCCNGHNLNIILIISYGCSIKHHAASFLKCHAFHKELIGRRRTDYVPLY